MTTASQTHQDVTVEVAGGNVHVAQGGSGDPLIVVHHDIGSPGWLDFYERLAQHHTVYVPDLPGYGQSDRPEWARNIRDIVILLGMTMDKLGLDRVSLVGLGYGGWLAAELATMGPQRIERMALVNPMGILPSEGEILDQFLVSHEAYVQTGFHNQDHFVDLFTEEASTDQLVDWDICREMTTRVGWKPYMFNAALPHLLKSVDTETLIVYAEHNQIVPRSVAQAYADAMPNARLEVLPDAGHFAEMEQPEALVALLSGGRSR